MKSVTDGLHLTVCVCAVCVQLFRFNERGQIAYGERCIETRGGNTLHIIYCPVDPSGPWEYDKV